MPKVHILPLDITVEAADGQTIMEAAWEGDLYWPTTCGGQGICTTCACTVAAGQDNLEPMGRGERKTLAEERGAAAVDRGDLRLACQARVHGDVTVTKPGVRPA
jgi:2Fe-2S ferredoxin